MQSARCQDGDCRRSNHRHPLQQYPFWSRGSEQQHRKRRGDRRGRHDPCHHSTGSGRHGRDQDHGNASNGGIRHQDHKEHAVPYASSGAPCSAASQPPRTMIAPPATTNAQRTTSPTNTAEIPASANTRTIQISNVARIPRRTPSPRRTCDASFMERRPSPAMDIAKALFADQIIMTENHHHAPCESAS